MTIQIVTLPNGKELIFLGLHIYQRWPGKEPEPIDARILEFSPIPRSSTVEQLVV